MIAHYPVHTKMLDTVGNALINRHLHIFQSFNLPQPWQQADSVRNLNCQAWSGV